MTREPVQPTQRGLRRLPATLAAVVATVTLLVAGLAAPATAAAQASAGWQAGRPPLSTPWTSQVGPSNAHPEYPRPQLTRARWMNLNGVWQYGAASSVSRSSAPIGRSLGERILVPYPPESALSGIQRHDDTMFYRRTFEVPRGWRGQRVLLHFGAVDQEATVWLNGQQVASHSGGYTGFSADVTGALKAGGPQELVVGAVDRNENSDYPVGKQRNDPNGILYTGSSGIWQTVWLEPVSRAHVEKVDITPNAGAGRFTIVPRVTGAGASRVELTARPSGGGPVVARASGQVGSPLTVAPAHPRLWSPSSPYLYHFDIRLLDRNGKALDTVGSYAGLRSVGLVRDSKGRERIALNGRVLFQHGPLDQGFWPDGIYTAPTDSALRFDLEQTKALGFNMVRKHLKVEPDRWYYWADKLGLMVWQDMPSLPIDLSSPPGTNSPPTTAQRQNYQAELAEMIEAHRSTTSIVTWVAFNEGWGEFGTRQVAGDILAQDPTRLVDASSGVNCCYSEPDTGAGQIYDDHTYVGPGTPTARAGRAAVDGEYGGLGLVLPGHVWPGRPQAYEMEKTKAQLTKRYGQLSDALARAVPARGISAGVYTQATDVENEVNGLLSYDRRVVKADTAAVRAHNLRVIRAGSQ